MTTLSEIRAMPTTLEANDVRDQLMNLVESAVFSGSLYRTKYSAPSGFHESVLRSYHIVQKVKELLNRMCPNDILLELIRDMEGEARS